MAVRCSRDSKGQDERSSMDAYGVDRGKLPENCRRSLLACESAPDPSFVAPRDVVLRWSCEGFGFSEAHHWLMASVVSGGDRDWMWTHRTRLSRRR
eukprot:9479479-Pyramimonas_sp.AAC.1